MTFDEWWYDTQPVGVAGYRAAWQAGYEAGKSEAAPSQEPVAKVRLHSELRSISGASMGLGCSDGFVTDRYLKVEFINYNMHSPERSAFKDGDFLYATPPDAAAQIVSLQMSLAEWVTAHGEQAKQIAKLESQLAAATRLINEWIGDPPAKEWAEWEALK